MEIVAERGGRVTIADIGHLFGSTAVDHQWERLVPTWCDPPLTLAELEAVAWPIVHERVDQLSLRPGVANLIDAATANNWKVALATGHAPDRLHGRLERLGLLHKLDAIVLAGEVRNGKPAPDIFLEAASRLGVRTDDCVVVEDSLPGCQAAVAAAMAVIVCPSQVTTHLDFPPAAHRVSSLTEICLDDVESLRRPRPPS